MKEAYYFSHDSNARYDPKITAMRGVYGSEGYAWFWILVEMMREQAGYKLDMRSKYAFHAFASQMQCEPLKAEEFIRDCIKEFELFASDDSYFWSESLARRMKDREERSEKARASAQARWSRNAAPEKDSPEQKEGESCDDDANASKNDALKESKVKESKEDKKTYAQYVAMTEAQYQKLVDQYGPGLVTEMVSVLDNYKGSNGKKYKDDYRAILSWVVEKVLEKHKSNKQPNSLESKNQEAMRKIREAEERERSGSAEIVPRHPEYV